MPAVLVHGHPETPAVWSPLVALLERSDIVCLNLPGYGVGAPVGFEATKDAYTDWLIGELESIGEPVDLVGHDWGGGFVIRVACLRPDLIRSWASDIAGVLHPDYVWHDGAQIWQTPTAGEQFYEAMISTPKADLIARYVSIGINAETAESFAGIVGPEMSRCALALYRSAAQPAMTKWGADANLAQARPGLVIIAEEDQYVGGTEKAETMALQMGARPVRLPGLGHWWMQADPKAGAAVLNEFWSSLS